MGVFNDSLNVHASEHGEGNFIDAQLLGRAVCSVNAHRCCPLVLQRGSAELNVRGPPPRFPSRSLEDRWLGSFFPPFPGTHSKLPSCYVLGLCQRLPPGAGSGRGLCVRAARQLQSSPQARQCPVQTARLRNRFSEFSVGRHPPALYAPASLRMPRRHV